MTDSTNIPNSGLNKAKKQKVKLQLKSPSQQRSKQTVATILEACERIIVKEGFFGVSTDKIAKEAGVSIGSLYQFFGNKESVVSALIQDMFERDLKFFREHFQILMAKPKEERPKAMIQAGIDIYSTRQELRARVQNIYQYLLDTNYFQNIMSIYEEYVTQLIDVPGRNPRLVARLFCTALIGIFDSAVVKNPNFSQDKAYVDEVHRLLGEYLRPNFRS